MKKKFGPYSFETSNENKVLFPKDNITKGNLIEYYEKNSDIILYHITDRPLTMHRFPDGIKKEGFFQKDVSDYFPKWIKTKTVSKEDGKVRYVLCQNKATLSYLANQACITPHIWLAKSDRIKTPDKMVFDLDPPTVNKSDFEIVKEGAKHLKEILEKCGLVPFVMTTGSSGLHVVVPIYKKSSSFNESREFAREISECVEGIDKAKFTTKYRKEKRKGRLFIDYTRNSFAQTSVAPYSIRPIDGAPVATPLKWSELGRLESSRKYNINSIQKRVSKGDPWIDIFSHARSLKEAKRILRDKRKKIRLEKAR